VLDLIQDCLKHKKSGSMYVCGLPGTGKSLTVSEAGAYTRPLLS
jgi:cell division control protein 6